MGNRIWIELDNPYSPLNYIDDAEVIRFANKQCELANNMLKRLLAPEHAEIGVGFWWSSSTSRYNYTTDASGSYLELPDRGHWLNLDYMGGEL